MRESLDIPVQHRHKAVFFRFFHFLPVASHWLAFSIQGGGHKHCQVDFILQQALEASSCIHSFSFFYVDCQVP